MGLTLLRVLRAAAGRIAVCVLIGLERIPPRIALAVGTLLLPLYFPFRTRTLAKLYRLVPPVGPFRYYRMRLRLVLLSLRHLTGKPDGCTQKVEGGDRFADALASGKPVVLIGWHQGPVELLHRIPAAAVKRLGEPDRPFFVMTASAFAPALASWMARVRSASGVTVIPPGSREPLRAWARGNGVLAVMADQVPGEPEAWLHLHAGDEGSEEREGGESIEGREGCVRIPWPSRLMEWIVAREPEVLVVSVRLESGSSILFRYDRVEVSSGDALRQAVASHMQVGMDQAPEQYNWSYRKTGIAAGKRNND